jgi:hypothetical protein
LAYADEFIIVGENICNIRENIGALIDASKEVGTEVNPVKILMSHCQNVGPKHSMKIGKWSFEDVKNFKYLQ